MKWNIITHNIQGLNDPESIAKERCFINSFTSRADVYMFQEHKLKEKTLDDL